MTLVQALAEQTLIKLRAIERQHDEEGVVLVSEYVACLAEALAQARRETWEAAAKREEMWHRLVEMMIAHDVSVAQSDYQTIFAHNRFVERIQQRQCELMKVNWCRQQAKETP